MQPEDAHAELLAARDRLTQHAVSRIKELMLLTGWPLTQPSRPQMIEQLLEQGAHRGQGTGAEETRGQGTGRRR